MTESIVIVGAARTPMGGFQGDFSSLAAHDLGGVAIKAAVERAGIAPDTRRRSAVRQLPDGRPGPGAGAPGGLQGRPARQRRRRHAQQDVRLGHEGRDVRARHAAGGHARGHGGRRHGKHDQRALPDAQGPRRLPHGPRPHLRPHDARRPGRRLPAGPLDGHLRRGLRRQVQVHARAAGRLRHRQRASAPRPPPPIGRLQGRDRAGDGQGPRRRHRDRDRRRPGQGQARQDPARSSRPSRRRAAPSPPRRARRSTTAPPRW